MKYEMVKAYTEARKQFGEDGPNETAFANCQAFIDGIRPGGFPPYWFDEDIAGAIGLGICGPSYSGRAFLTFSNEGVNMLSLSGVPAKEDVQPRVREVTGQTAKEIMAIVESWLLP